MAYYSLFYQRQPDTPTDKDQLHVHVGGWCSFWFLIVLGWWSVVLDLVLFRFEHLGLGLSAITAPILLALIAKQGVGLKWLWPWAFLAQAVYFWLLCGSALLLRNGWPRRWRASKFLNVLGTDELGNATFHQD